MYGFLTMKYENNTRNLAQSNMLSKFVEHDNKKMGYPPQDLFFEFIRNFNKNEVNVTCS
jgi:hypothetical protein